MASEIDALNAERCKSYVGHLKARLGEAGRQNAVLNAELAEVAAHRDRLKVALYADSELAIAHRAAIESIRHGGLKILLRLANDPAELRRLMGIEKCPGLCELATELLECEDETDAAGVLNEWVGK